MRLRAVILILCGLLLLASGEAYARRQSNAVRQERTAAQRRQQQTRRNIAQNLEQTRAELNRLESLDAQIELSEQREHALAIRVDSIHARAEELTDSVRFLSERVARTDSTYNSSLRAMRRVRNNGGTLAFIFSAEGFTQGLRRFRYLRKLASWNRREGERLRERRTELSAVVQRLDSAGTRLERAMTILEAERARLERDRSEAATLVERLQQRGAELNRILAEQQQQMQALDDELRRAIAAEEAERREAEERAAREAAERVARETAERAAREAEAQRQAQDSEVATSTPTPEPEPEPTPAPTPSTVNSPAAMSAAELTASFESKKGQIPMPVRGNIVGDFGQRTHRELSNVKINNNGIDIETTSGAEIKSVHEGTVSMIIVMEGYNKVVLVRHGDYLTVYAGLEELDVRKGDNVRQGQRLGKVAPGVGNTKPRLHFEVRHEVEKLNPREWLK